MGPHLVNTKFASWKIYSNHKISDTNQFMERITTSKIDVQVPQYEWREESIAELLEIGLERERKMELERQQPQRLVVNRTERNQISIKETLNFAVPRTPITLETYGSSTGTASFTGNDSTIGSQIQQEEIKKPISGKMPSQVTHFRSKSDQIPRINKGEKRDQKELVFDCYGNKKRKKSRPGDAFEMTFTLK